MLKGSLEMSFTIGRPIIKLISKLPLGILLSSLKVNLIYQNLPNIAGNHLALLFNVRSLKPYLITRVQLIQNCLLISFKLYYRFGFQVGPKQFLYYLPLFHQVTIRPLNLYLDPLINPLLYYLYSILLAVLENNYN